MTAFPTLERGRGDRLGAHPTDHGINFAVHSSGDRVDLCLFDAGGLEQRATLPLPARTGDVWHGFLPGARSGVVYGYRAHGRYAPGLGDRFNASKLLIDPYARELVGSFVWHEAVCAHAGGDAGYAGPPNLRDSAPFVPKCRVARPLEPSDRPPRPCIPWHDTVLYEMHVRGFTRLHPDVPPELRGTLRALASPCVIEHLRTLGVTTIQMLPVAEFIDERSLVARGLRNYWGYNPIAFFAAHRAYLASGSVAEFADVIDRLHLAGIEVVLDVVFNHTAEGDAAGPTLSFRGFDNAAYYRLDPVDPGRYQNESGCGNTLDLANPLVIALVLDALRYWAVEVGVDGFRFDLAAALSRDRSGRFDAFAPLWRALADDAVLSALKLIVEPWDMAGHHLGEFREPLVEWNDRFRDTVRRFWRGDAGMTQDLATRFAGSGDLFGHRAGSSSSGVNFVTAHDGFTLADLVAYRSKHNEANGEGNRDGATENYSSNEGHEGPTADPSVLLRRTVRMRSMLATLMLSRGIPMLLAGDEVSRTQAGNNNAYCQDNPSAWVDWDAARDASRDHVAFVARLAQIRSRIAALLADATSTGSSRIEWLREDGSEFQPADWQDVARHVLGACIRAGQDAVTDACRCIFVAFNGHAVDVVATLPACDRDWLCVVDTAFGEPASTLHSPGSQVVVTACALRAFVPRDTPVLGVPDDVSDAAERAGLSTDVEDADGRRRLVPVTTLTSLMRALGAPRIATASKGAPSCAAEERCWLPPCLAEGRRRWMLSAQVYGLRSARSWGIGDFDDVGLLAELGASVGATGLMVSPVHAPRSSEPERASPYAPDSRLALNPLLVSIAAADRMDPSPRLHRFLEQPDVRAALAHAVDSCEVDYSAVARLKLEALALMHLDFRERHLAPATSLGERFLRFQADESPHVRTHATLEAWHAHEAGSTRRRTPDRTELDGFGREFRIDVESREFQQWLARLQWDQATARARSAGMELGLVADLALGAAVDGAEALHWGDLIVRDVQLGAPPDAFARRGQTWGVPPWNPNGLAARGFRPYVELVRFAMRNAGALRIDHVMGLMRQFWIPSGAPPSAGTYVRFPAADLLAATARESMRARCMVIGEDLGNVPRGFRERMARVGMLGFRITRFETEAGGTCKPPEAYAPLAIAAMSTHDLPTLAGIWGASQLPECASGPPARDLDAVQARKDRTMLMAAFQPYGEVVDVDGFVDSAHRFLAATSSCLAAVQIEDVLRMTRPANTPGTPDAAPNWRQRLPVRLEALADDRRFTQLSRMFARRVRLGDFPATQPMMS